MLLETGGWWVDMDTVCLKPFDFPADYVISSEMCRGAAVMDLAALRVPPGSALAQYMWDVCEAKDPGRLRWGETGPRLLAEAVRHCGLEEFIQPVETFCPVDYEDWESVILRGDLELEPGAFAIHLWNEMWRDSATDKDCVYPAHCLYSKLKARYSGSYR
jgi:hypothetical protein